MGWYVELESIPMNVIFNAKETNGHTPTTIENHLIHREIAFCCFPGLSLTIIDPVTMSGGHNIAKKTKKCYSF